MSSFPMTRRNLVVPRQEASPIRSVPLMLFVLAFLRQNLTNYVCTQISCLTNSFIRILGSLVCNIVTFYLLSLVLCCDIYRSTLISIMYPACMITVHDRKSRTLH